MTNPVEEAALDAANHDCLAKRRPGEPWFILLGRDPDGHNIVQMWADRRLAAGGDPEHCRLAYDTAERMKDYAANPANRPASAPDASAYAALTTKGEDREAVARMISPGLRWSLAEVEAEITAMPPPRDGWHDVKRISAYRYNRHEDYRQDALTKADAILAHLRMGTGEARPTIEPMFWEWLQARDLCPDPDADGTVDWLDIITVLNDHENELLSFARPAPASEGEG